MGDRRLAIRGTAAMAALTAAALWIVWLGVYPKPVLDVINPAVENTMTTIGQHDPAPRVPRGTPAATAPRTAEGPHR